MAKNFCNENNSTIVEFKIDYFMRIPIPAYRFVYWIKAEYSEDLEDLEIAEEYRIKIRNELESAKERPGFIFLAFNGCTWGRECNFCFFNTPINGLKLCFNFIKRSFWAVERELSPYKEFEFICTDKIYEDGKILVQVTSQPDCDILQVIIFLKWELLFN